MFNHSEALAKNAEQYVRIPQEENERFWVYKNKKGTGEYKITYFNDEGVKTGEKYISFKKPEDGLIDIKCENLESTIKESATGFKKFLSNKFVFPDIVASFFEDLKTKGDLFS